jgi:hypothetical protein
MKCKTSLSVMVVGWTLAAMVSGCQGAKAPTVTASDFDRVVLASKEPVLVDFSAPER